MRVRSVGIQPYSGEMVSQKLKAKLEIGVTPWLFDDGGLSTGFAAQAERAEALGFHSIFIPEHHFSPGARSPLNMRARNSANSCIWAFGAGGVRA